MTAFEELMAFSRDTEALAGALVGAGLAGRSASSSSKRKTASPTWTVSPMGR